VVTGGAAGRSGGGLGNPGAGAAGRSGGALGAPGLTGGAAGGVTTERSERGVCASGLALPGAGSGKGWTGMTRGPGGILGEAAATRTSSGPPCGAAPPSSVRSPDCGAEPPGVGRAAPVEPPARGSGSSTRPATLVPSSSSPGAPPTTMPATTLNEDDERGGDEEPVGTWGEGVPSTTRGESGSISVWTTAFGASAVSGSMSRRATRPAVTVDATTSTLSAAVATTIPAPPLYRLNPTTLRLAGSELLDLLPG
jgi:hypothetical protein